jgi:F0F1-type ATP synthase membrane subunit a
MSHFFVINWIPFTFAHYSSYPVLVTLLAPWPPTVKVKVKLSLCLIKYHTIKTYSLIKHHAVKIHGEWRYSTIPP